jgi:hypothetical protein
MAQEVETTERTAAERFPPERYAQAKEALKRLAELRKTLPPIDAVALIREGRELLAQRGAEDDN